MKMLIALHFDMFTHMDTKKALIKLRDDLKEKSSAGSFASQEDLNMILVHLGECDGSKQIVATSDMFKAAKEIDLEPFTLEIDRVDKFDKESGQVWWAGIQESKPLLEYRKALVEQLEKDGFDISKDEFIPRVELGKAVQSKAEPFVLEQPVEVNVEKIDIMKLRHGCGSSIQESVNTCTLAKKM